MLVSAGMLAEVVPLLGARGTFYPEVRARQMGPATRFGCAVTTSLDRVGDARPCGRDGHVPAAQVIGKVLRILSSMIFESPSTLFGPFCDAHGLTILASVIDVRPPASAAHTVSAGVLSRSACTGGAGGGSLPCGRTVDPSATQSDVRSLLECVANVAADATTLPAPPVTNMNQSSGMCRTGVFHAAVCPAHSGATHPHECGRLRSVSVDRPRRRCSSQGASANPPLPLRHPTGGQLLRSPAAPARRTSAQCIEGHLCAMACLQRGRCVTW